jgi:hypothetical protein
MKNFCILLSAITALVAGCSPANDEPTSPPLNEPAGAQSGPAQDSPKTTSEISEKHGWTGTNESGRSTNNGISPGGANTHGTGTP